MQLKKRSDLKLIVIVIDYSEEVHYQNMYVRLCVCIRKYVM